MNLATVELLMKQTRTDGYPSDLLAFANAIETDCAKKLDIAQRVAQTLSDDGYYGKYVLGKFLWDEFAASYGVAP